MGKRQAYLHVGLPGAGDVVDTAVQRHRGRLAELDVQVPTKAREESFRAAVEVRRLHQQWGLRRKDVEGAWSGVCRRALKGRGTLLVSQTALAGATPDEIDLLTSQLPGLKLHVVLTVAAPDGWSEPGDPETDLTDVLARWSRAVRDPQRLHVVIAADRDAAWRQLGDVVGFGTRSLPVDGLQPAPVAPRAVGGAHAERLRQRAERWQGALAEGGYDVRGDPADLLPTAATGPTDVDGALLRTTRALAEARRETERLGLLNEALEARLTELETPRRRRRAA